MIVRIYRCTVVAGKEAEFRKYAFSKSHPWLRDRPGLIAFYAGRPMPGADDRTHCVVELWEGVSAIQAVFGENWQQPVKLPDEARGYIDSATVEH